MGTTYSASEARIQFAEVLRQVREGETVTVSYRGEPVAEIRPIQEEPPSTEARLADLEKRGVLTRPASPGSKLRPVAHRPGALRRFLAERHE